MFTLLPAIVYALQNIYFSQLAFVPLFGHLPIFINCIIDVLFFLITTLFEFGIILFVLNLTNHFPHRKQLYKDVAYSFFISFILAKVLQAVFLSIIYNIPLIASYLAIEGPIMFVLVLGFLQYIILKNQLTVDWYNEDVDSEPIEGDVMAGTIAANAFVFLIYFLLKYFP